MSCVEVPESVKRLLEQLSHGQEMPAKVLNHHAMTLAADNGWVYEHQGLVGLTGAGTTTRQRKQTAAHRHPGNGKTEPMTPIQSAYKTPATGQAGPRLVSSVYLDRAAPDAYHWGPPC